MKTRKKENNPIIREKDLKVSTDTIKIMLSNYLSKDYPAWLKKMFKEELRNAIRSEITKELEREPTYLTNIIKDTIKSEIKRNLKITMGGYNSIEANLKYNGVTISSASKYHPRG